MNHLNCEEGFGRKYIGDSGDRIRLTNVKTRLVLDGSLTEKLSEMHRNISIMLDGTTMRNILRQSEWEVAILPPVIEDGIYLKDTGLVYRAMGGSFYCTYLEREGSVGVSEMTAREFAAFIKNGRMKRLVEG